jgi:hypothetical protein
MNPPDRFMKTGLGSGWILAIHPHDIVEYSLTYQQAEKEHTKSSSISGSVAKTVTTGGNSGNSQFD